MAGVERPHGRDQGDHLATRAPARNGRAQGFSVAQNIHAAMILRRHFFCPARERLTPHHQRRGTK